MSGWAREGQYTAVVHAADGIRFVAAEASSRELTEALAGYVESRCDDYLWPAVAAEVHALMDDGKPDSAIATYFANVGQRWDTEELELRVLATPDVTLF